MKAESVSLGQRVTAEEGQGEKGGDLCGSHSRQAAADRTAQATE
jgi:hypothetical protein